MKSLPPFCLALILLGVVSGKAQVFTWEFDNSFAATPTHAAREATPVGNPTFVPGIRKCGIAVNPGDRVENPNVPGVPLSGNTVWTFNVWVNLPGPPEAGAYIAGFGPNQADDLNTSPAQGRAFMAGGGPADNNINFSGLDTGVPYPVGRWAMLTATLLTANPAGLLTVYLDGTEIASAPHAFANIPNNQARVTLGGQSFYGTELAATFDRAAVWGFAQTASGITNLFNSSMTQPIEPSIDVDSIPINMGTTFANQPVTRRINISSPTGRLTEHQLEVRVTGDFSITAQPRFNSIFTVKMNASFAGEPQGEISLYVDCSDIPVAVVPIEGVVHSAIASAYNDFVDSPGQSHPNVNRVGNVAQGALVDFSQAFGVLADLHIDLTASAVLETNLGRHPTGGDALLRFPQEIAHAKGIVNNGSSPITLTLSGMTNSGNYDLSLYSNRGASPGLPYSPLTNAFELGGADSFRNASSSGVAQSGVFGEISTLNVNSNYTDVVRYSAIDPGADGIITVTISPAGGSTPEAILNLLRVDASDELPRSWTLNINTNSSDSAPGTYLLGNAQKVDDVIRLTTAGQQGVGGWLIHPPSDYIDFATLQWKVRIGGGTSGEGMSVNWGFDFTEPPAADNYERGTGRGLSAAIDTFNNGSGDFVGIELRWDGIPIASTTSSPGFFRTGQYLNADLTFTPRTINNPARVFFSIHDQVQTVDTDAFLPVGAGAEGMRGRILFAAHNSSSRTDDHWIKDVDLRLETHVHHDGIYTNMLSRKFLELRALEVVQVIQNWNNSVPLVAGKQTWVRAHIASLFGFPPSSSTGGFRLRGFRNGQEILPAQTPINPGGMVQVMPRGNSMDATLNLRSQFTNTVNFRLPVQWRSNTVELRFEWDNGEVVATESAEADGVARDGGVRVKFEEVPAMPLRLFNVMWTNNNNAAMSLRANVAADIPPRVLSILPVPRVNTTPISSNPRITLTNRAPRSSTSRPRVVEVLGALATISASSTAQPKPIHYAPIQGENLNANYGEARPPSSIATGFEDTNVFRIGRIVPAHEIAHVLGRLHTALANNSSRGTCGEGGGVVFPDYSPLGPTNELRPTISPMNQGLNEYIFGLDTYMLSTLPGLNPVVDPRTCFEMMSYCRCTPDNPRAQWVSKRNYESMLTQVQRTYKPRPPGGGGTGGTAQPESTLHIAGTIHFPTEALTVSPLLEIPGDRSTIPIPGHYALRLLDATGRVLIEVPFSPEVTEDTDPQLEEGSFSLAVPADPAYDSMLILHEGTPLFSRVSSLNKPNVTLLSPNGGQTLASGPVAINWTANDPDGDELTFHVQYSSDNGDSWETLIGDWPHQTFTTDFSLLRGTANGSFRVIASDGFHSAHDQSDSVFTVENHPPELHLILPMADHVYVDDEQVVFLSNVLDLEDGFLDGPNVEWSSSMDGFLGSGSDLQMCALELSPGPHAIQCQAVDTGFLTANATVNIFIDHTRLTIRQSATPGFVIIEWDDSSATLQSANFLHSNPAMTQWQDVAGAQSGNLFPRSGSQKFYRLRR